MNKRVYKHIKDDLDIQCDNIFETLDILVKKHNLENTTKVKLELLEQCIDYLRLEKNNELK